jgi:hypothetical protein
MILVVPQIMGETNEDLSVVPELDNLLPLSLMQHKILPLDHHF